MQVFLEGTAELIWKIVPICDNTSKADGFNAFGDSEDDKIYNTHKQVLLV